MATNNGKVDVTRFREANFPHYFGEWLKCRREELNLTQAELAQCTCCSVFTIRKIETGERRPSKQLAGLLAQSLKISAENQTTFIRVARGELSVERLVPPNDQPSSDFQPKETFSRVRGNLPRVLTPFIGRDAELGTLNQLLHDPDCALLTIVGPGGIGKTRFALEAAIRSGDLFRDGIWFVPLVSLNSPALIVPAIAEAVGFKFQAPINPQEQLFRYLLPKKALLVVDNAEHLLEGAGIFADILKDCPQVKMLVTSRERLNLQSEWVFEIQGLPVPPDDRKEQFEFYSSVALFIKSARRACAGFEINEGERPWVLKICQAIGGMPLGIELSAAWVGKLSCEEIANEIGQNFDFLSVSMRDLPERHRSLRATLDHSWKLLNDEEKLILSRLSVFRGSFRREDAQNICGASLAVLSSLRDKTLLYRTDQEQYALHEIIRQYAGLKLAEQPDEKERVHERHALFYVQCLADWENALKGSHQVETLNTMAEVIDNLSQGWQHMISICRHRTGKGNQFYANLLHSALFSISLFYELRCRDWEAIALFGESVEYLKTVQNEFEGTEDHININSVLGHITACLGLHQLIVYQHAKARESLEEAINLLENNQSKVERAQAQSILAWIYYQQGKMQRSAELLKQSLAIFQDERNTWWYLLSSINLALVYVFSGNLSESERLCQEGSRLVAPGDLRLELPLRRAYAYLYYFRNDYRKAEQLIQENMQVPLEFKNHRGYYPYCLIDLSQVALATNRIDVAEKYIQEDINLLCEYGETYELALAILYLGKSLVARSEGEAGRDKFRQVIKMGHKFDAFYLVYWGLVNIARIYLIEGQTEKALEIALVLSYCPIEYKLAQEDGNRLLADLQAALPEGRIEATLKPVDNEISPEQAKADVLAYALRHETG